MLNRRTDLGVATLGFASDKKNSFQCRLLKKMVFTFWDRHGLVLQNFMPLGATINTVSPVGCHQVKVLRGFTSGQGGFLHENAPYVAAIKAADKFRSFKW
ncbi:hypothetical protein TNCT_590731 [Trichonephila clavata]|uniref:Uncharacterized protein n=1 Tax=Trichonephila clavata TaxID=2740835 RepID=A0A8X6LG69_TRICU|nr:hypothetical protein TNCT_590731 [Trichonephila clavata]